MAKEKPLRRKEILPLTRKIFHYWCGKFDIKKNIAVIEDKRLGNHMTMSFADDGTIELRINTDRILKFWTRSMAICGVLHEIGHILYNPNGYADIDTDEEHVVYEEMAVEIFSLILMKTYYPKEYVEVCRQTRMWLVDKDSPIHSFPVHAQAFFNIFDYKDRRFKKWGQEKM